MPYRVPRASKRQRCPDVHVALRIEVLRRLFEGSPLDRIDAIGELTEMQRWILFPPRCPCGADHTKLAANLLRCHRGLSITVRELGADMELNVVQWIRLAAVQGDTPAATERMQHAELLLFAFGGSAPAESADSAAPPTAA